ncbi:hypothetical protein R5R35_001160 [Gryllus longicercus]|uniref:Uncharacterized protein n=1 Tax=Gryllus longicercus TaxID=2509291 RepID=A0AAN9ZBI3_9ORTH
MDAISVIAESLLTIEEIKLEPEDFLDERGSIEARELIALKREVKKEKDDESQEINEQSYSKKKKGKGENKELEPPATVFRKVKEEITEEHEDFFATCREDVSNAVEECEERPGE